MRLPPDPPVDYGLERAGGMDALMRVRWADGSLSRLTTSLIGVEIPADHIEDEPNAFYDGFPGIATLPALKQVINGLSDSVEFGLPGISGAIAQMFDLEADLAEGAEFCVGKVFYDEALQLIGAARWVWIGQGGVFGLNRSGGAMRDGMLSDASYAVSLEVGTEQIIRAGAQLQSWSDAQIRQLHPDDAIGERTSLLTQGGRKTWPKF
ncbi:hypothetical protein [Hansschlegelia sp.]|uniref:hypothetical protein n=1 Tax=Hansschlegelia sp. TaxID=2041892 RepID=UPI002B972085|nr:hypothetical protein [Hansschlegelia sp.]HVI27628.1 hypothetical protein [Hansschlegelia sp.]